MIGLQEQVLIYGCSISKLNKTTVESEVFRKYGPVVYVASLMDRAMSLINQDQGTEAKQVIQCAKWVMFTYVIGDDE